MFKNKRDLRRSIFDHVRSAVGMTKASRISWYLKNKDEGAEARIVTAHSAPGDAIMLVRSVISRYSWPQAPKLSYTGMRHSGHTIGSDNIDTGVVTVTGEIRTPIGVTVGFDVPVEIRNGNLIEPSVMVMNGAVKVISQSSIDSMIGDNTTYGDMLHRSIYSVPDHTNAGSVRMPRRTPGMFRMSGVDPWELEDVNAPEYNAPGSPVSLKSGPGKCEACGRPYDYSPYAPYCSRKCLEYVERRDLSMQPAKRRGQVQNRTDLQHIFDTLAQQMQNEEEPTGKAGASKSAQAQQPIENPNTDEHKCAACGLFVDPREAIRIVGRYYHPECAEERERWAQARSEDPDIYLYRNHDPVEIHDNADQDRETELPTSRFLPGLEVRVTKRLAAPTRGGPREVIEDGAKGYVVRDMDGHGREIYVALDDGRNIVVQSRYLELV